MPTPRWQPISKLSMVTEHVEGTLQATLEQQVTLEEARGRPYVLDDATVARVVRVFTEQAVDIGLFEEQVRLWEGLELGATRRRDIAALAAMVARLREVNTAVLAPAAELGQGTIEKTMARTDAELGLEASVRRGQSRHGRPPQPHRGHGAWPPYGGR